MIGFAVLMFGMETMSSAVEPLAGNEKFTGILTMFSNPILGMLAGLVLTAVIQSSFCIHRYPAGTFHEWNTYHRFSDPDSDG